MLSDIARAFRRAWRQIIGQDRAIKMTWREFSEGWASLPTAEKATWTGLYVVGVTLFCWMALLLLKSVR